MKKLLFSFFLFLYLGTMSHAKRTNSLEIVELLTLILSQSMSLQDDLSIAIIGENQNFVKSIQEKLKATPFIMIQAQPVKIIVQDKIDSHTNVCLNLSKKKIQTNRDILTLVLHKKQVFQGAAIGIIFEQTRPRIYINQATLHRQNHQFEAALLEISRIIKGGN